MRRLFPTSTGRDSTLWPVLLLLLIVLVPSAGVLWMMRAAMENERLAGQQRQADAYRTHLEIAKRRVTEHWKQRFDRLDALAAELPPARAFVESVRDGLADSIVIFNGEWHVAYPAPTKVESTTNEPTDPDWIRAERLEFVDSNLDEAADVYRDVAVAATDPILAARARQAQARALFLDGDKRGAIRVLQSLRLDNSTTDLAGRSFAADAELRLLELLDAASPEWMEAATSLARRLNDYDGLLPPDQRLFLMRSLKSLQPDASLPSLEAEGLATAFLAEPLDAAPRGTLRPTAIGDLWQFRSPAGRVIALFKSPSLQQSIELAVSGEPLPAGESVLVRGPAQSEVASSEMFTVPLSPMLEGWRLSLANPGGRSLDLVANERMSFFLWTAVVVVSITAALALLAASLVRRQSRLTRLKNDLVATVSHELKTPLASIRLLVDTLLDADGSSPDAPFGDRTRAREYLEMISKENTRLSRLIDNFLTFSRMERGKHRFDFQPADAAATVDQAVAAVADRFDGITNTLIKHVDRPLPVVGDADALVTVVVNLLDNAWKYSDEPKRIAVSACRDGERIVISVEDNGIGLSPRAVRKVFDRFYQVDQHLSRTQGGCGLGLSIVKYVVEAHGGNVMVESRLGAGTTFTVSLPADVAAAQGPRPQSLEPSGTHA